ncbi:hypothetical protein BV61_05110 [Candidatus Synechococcus spongiarum LMB bulk15M]|uniref:Uncharacterized protein n=1 Tax=Candidatus Synechococcus spongiarum LMB bulk15M TaxID=1943582 RepID=A0A1T1CRE8_9SYNE|nr:hypothetical protein BV61_05110 [Candidatus Synechococcus spongiarum LMB bulk15M]
MELTPVTAEAGDYGPLAGITIPAGATSGTGSIATVQDVDSDDETFTVAVATDKLPVGVIAVSPASVVVTVKDLPQQVMQVMQAWNIRLGRTVSQQVMDALQSRFTATPPQPGLHLTVAGEELNGAVPLAENRSALAKLLGFETLTSHQLVQDSSFSFSPSVSAPHLSFWGEGTLSSFSGKAAAVTLDSDVTTALLGAEWNAERWQAGAALSHSWGNGGYEAENGMEGEISTNMVSIPTVATPSPHGWGSGPAPGTAGVPSPSPRRGRRTTPAPR